jgi:hypothetical protein
VLPRISSNNSEKESKSTGSVLIKTAMLRLSCSGDSSSWAIHTLFQYEWNQIRLSQSICSAFRFRLAYRMPFALERAPFRLPPISPADINVGQTHLAISTHHWPPCISHPSVESGDSFLSFHSGLIDVNRGNPEWRSLFICVVCGTMRVWPNCVPQPRAIPVKKSVETMAHFQAAPVVLNLIDRM